MSDKQNEDSVEIKEEHRGMPRWGWLFIATTLIYGFLIGPFDWFSP